MEIAGDLETYLDGHDRLPGRRENREHFRRFARGRIERCFQDAKSELGLNHAEVRKYRAIHRHLALTAVNHFFLQSWMLKRRRGRGRGGPPSAGRPTRPRTSSRERSRAS